MIRFGLCCLFRNEPIRFRTTTAKLLGRLPRQEQLGRISEICRLNCENLAAALVFCHQNGIGAFRVSSPLFPRYTHPEVGYQLDGLPGHAAINELLAKIKTYREDHDIRLSLHPDQFVVLSSPRPEVVAASRRELEYHGMLAEKIGAGVITLHGGGGYGDKLAALSRLRENFALLSERVKERLALENDDRTYTVADLLPVAESLEIPLVYDVHHHRCLADGLSVEEATRRSLLTWQRLGREPYFHISSPRNGWRTGATTPHADYVDPADFPPCWLHLEATVDVEAKAKELAVLRLKKDLGL